MKKIFTLLNAAVITCGLTAQVQWVGNMSPMTSGSHTPTITVEVFKNGVTLGPGPGTGIHCEILYGTVSAFGQPWTNITSIQMAYFGENSNRDVFSGTMNVPTGSTYEYTCRCADVPNPMQLEWLYQGAENGKLTAPLPITLVSFKGKTQNKTHELTWATASEINNRYFAIERAGADYEWEEIAIINGAGTTDQFRSYRFKDEQPLNGSNYYRLRQVDFDGRTTYSYSIELNSERSLVQNVYPNPVTDFLHLQLNEEAQVVLTNTIGKEVFNQNIDGTYPINMTELDRGIYLLSVRDNNGQELHTEKIVKY